MPQFDRPYPLLSYITAAGDEVILSCPAYKKWWECYGRQGFAAPPVKHVTREYADGATDTLAVIMEPRPLMIQMVINGESSVERDEILFDMASRLIQLGSRKDWGKLKVKRSDGKTVYIDCVYTGGLDQIADSLPNAEQFFLSFYAGNGYFYDVNETLLSTSPLSGLIYLSDDLYLGDDIFLTDGVTSIDIDNRGEMFYPVVDIFGPASVIRVTNHATGKVLAVNSDFALLANQRLTFNCQEHERGITLMAADGTITDVTEKLLLGSTLVWEIVKGENPITFYYTNSSSDTFSRIRYRQRYFSA